MWKATLILLLPILGAAAYASSVTVTNSILQTNRGILTYIFFETSSGPATATPATNTAQTPSGSSASYAVNHGTTAFLWSTQFTSAASVSAGTWVLDFWASASAAGSMTVSILITDSTGVTQTTIANSVSTPSIGTTKAQFVMRFSGVASSIPSGGYIVATLTAASGGSNPNYTLYWGSGQQTNYQVPMVVLS